MYNRQCAGHKILLVKLYIINDTLINNRFSLNGKEGVTLAEVARAGARSASANY